MAPKKPSHLLHDPPSASTSQHHEEEEEEEEEEFEEEEEEVLGEESEEEENELNHQRSKDQLGDESSEEEEGYDTDDNNARNSPMASNVTIKPTVNKNSYSVEPPKPTTKRALIEAEGWKDLTKKTTLANDHIIEKDNKGATKKAGSANGRIFTPADDIVLLGRMIDYQKQIGADPQADFMAFLEFVKGSFLFELTRSQVYEKVRRLKKKFFANLGKGKNFIPTKPLDQECFELSKKIWGGNNLTGSVANSGDPNDNVVGNGIEHTETVKTVDDVLLTKKSARGKSSEGTRREKGEKMKERHKKKSNKKKMDDGPKIVEEEAEPLTNEDVMKDKEHLLKDDEDCINDKEDVETDDEDVMKNKEDLGMDDEDGMKDKEDGMEDKEIVEDVMKDEEDVGSDEGFMKDNEDVGSDDENNEQNIQSKYPHWFASFIMEMPDSQRKLMMEAISLVDDEKAREFDDSWIEMQMEEMKVNCRKMEMVAEHSRVLMNALKKKG